MKFGKPDVIFLKQNPIYFLRKDIHSRVNYKWGI